MHILILSLQLSCSPLLCPPCHPMLSVPETLETTMTSLLHCFLSIIVYLSSASFILVTSCISSIHLLLGRPLLRLPSPHASIIRFSNPSDRITCPKNPSFILIAVCCSISSSSISIERGKALNCWLSESVTNGCRKRNITAKSSLF